MNFSQSKVTILTEAGKSIGFGHYTRCIALFDELVINGFDVQFIVHENFININDERHVKLNWKEEVDAISPRSESDILIVDSYLASNEILSKLYNKFYSLFIIDDYNRIEYPAEYIINPNVFFDSIDYSNQSGKCVGGKDFVILRKEFRTSKSFFSESSLKLNILVSVGGSDYRNLLQKIVITLDEVSNIEFEVVVIDPEGKLDIKSEQELNYFKTQTSIEMVGHMQKADLVISACGQTLHELASLAKPTIGICIDFDQILNQEFYYKRGFLKSLISWDDKDFSQKIKDNISYFSISENRKKIKQISNSIINVDGVKKIVELIENKNNAFTQ